MTALILRHFDLMKKVILKTNFLKYVNNNIVSQYDDDKNLHSIIFYNKNIISAECNYKIYDKKLLIIIYYVKH